VRWPGNPPVGGCLELLVLQSLSKDGSSQKNIKEKTSAVVKGRKLYL
jgi:hypothetical protein